MDEQSVVIDTHEDARKRAAHDMEAVQQRTQSLSDENDKLNKSKKKLQAEV